jgi:hypothetical protein
MCCFYHTSNTVNLVAATKYTAFGVEPNENFAGSSQRDKAKARLAQINAYRTNLNVDDPPLNCYSSRTDLSRPVQNRERE